MTVFAFTQTAKAEEIHFNNDIFILKYSTLSQLNKGYENEYYLKNEGKNNWTKMVGIYYYPEVSNPLKFADKECKTIESTETNVLLKFIENKKADKAALSYLQNGSANGKNFFEYNIFKYEKSKNCGTIAFQYAKKFQVYDNQEVAEVKKKFSKFRPRAMKKINDFEIPDVVEIKLNDLP